MRIMFTLISICCFGVVSLPHKASAQITVVSGSADIIGVSATGPTGKYTFRVTIKSPDTGCDQYADWWEVMDAEGRLVYRRILAHSHVNEQPFTRQGGIVTVAEDENIWIRAHMNNSGYGGATYFGSVSEGFSPRSMPEGLGVNVENESPQPTGCAF